MFLYEFYLSLLSERGCRFLRFYLAFSLGLCSTQAPEFEEFFKQATVNTVIKLQVYYATLVFLNCELFCPKSSSQGYLAMSEEVLVAKT